MGDKGGKKDRKRNVPSGSGIPSPRPSTKPTTSRSRLIPVYEPGQKRKFAIRGPTCRS